MGLPFDDQVQGDVVPGFRRAYHATFRQAFVVATIRNPKVAGDAIRALVSEISWASEVRKRQTSREARPAQPYLNVAFTRRGLDKVFGDRARGGSVAFAEGLAARSEKKEKEKEKNLFGSPEHWRIGVIDHEVDLVLNVASEGDPPDVDRFVDRFGSSVDVLEEVLGATLPGGVEHFGFRDGLSQPGVKEANENGGPMSGTATTSTRPLFAVPHATYADVDNQPGPYAAGGGAVAAPAHLAGAATSEQDVRDTRPTVPAARPTVPADQFIVDPGGTGFRSNGSYMVWLQLKQDVDAFRAVCRRLADALSDAWGRTVLADEAAALLMGRRRDGTSLAQASVHDANDFSYLQDATVPSDVYGVRCPLGAHARKMNPRTLATLPQLILRRGIPYTDGNEVGLLFVSYQSDIENQFERLQGEWANSTELPEQAAFPDAITSAVSRAGTTIEIPNPDGRGSVPFELKNDWVVPRGGLYLFVPSKATLSAAPPE